MISGSPDRAALAVFLLCGSARVFLCQPVARVYLEVFDGSIHLLAKKQPKRLNRDDAVKR